MFNGKGYNLSDIAAVTAGNRNNDGVFGGDGAWWLILLFLFAVGEFAGQRRECKSFRMCSELNKPRRKERLFSVGLF